MKTAARVAVLQNRPALVIRAAIGLALAYAFATRAIDTGSYWQYLATLVFLGLSLKLIIRAARK
jgi:hypothetical protein